MVDTKREYVGRYEERLALQESGAALSNSSTYVSGLLLYKVCIKNRWKALHMQFRLKQRVFKQYVLRKYFSDLQMVVDVKTVCVISVKEEVVLVREVKTIVEQ